VCSAFLQRFELELDSWRALELDVKAWLGTMNRDVERFVEPIELATDAA
jgi:hypothetical protein